MGDTLPPYTHDELAYDNVEIKKISIDGKLETYFEEYEFDLSMGLDGDESIPEVEVRAEVERLNHEPFTFHIEAEAKAAELATIRIFFCPKYDYNHIEMELDEARWGCIEMDKFWHKMSAGSNTILRKSSESSVTSKDRVSFNELIKKADEAVASGSDLPMTDDARSCGHPQRMLLPKGKEDGHHAYCGVKGEHYPDKKPMGFPLDRHVHDAREFKVPNIHWETVQVFHNSHH